MLLYNTGLLLLVIIAVLGLEVAELKEEDMPILESRKIIDFYSNKLD